MLYVDKLASREKTILYRLERKTTPVVVITRHGWLTWSSAPAGMTESTSTSSLACSFSCRERCEMGNC
jgi:hypothetical protein